MELQPDPAAGARLLTAYVWEKLHDRPLSDPDLTAADVLVSHLDPYDVEDLIYVWLQIERGYVALPRARQRDTPAYEFTMLHRTSGRRGIAQVKTGSTPVDLDALAAAVADDATDTFAFATSGTYLGDHASVTEVVENDELLRLWRSTPTSSPHECGPGSNSRARRRTPRSRRQELVVKPCVPDRSPAGA